MNQTARFISVQLFFACMFLTPVFFKIGRGAFFPKLDKISELKNYSIDEKRDIYKTFDTEAQNDKGFPIDPFDLMNRLKRAGAMNDATTPSDALDDALNAFDESEY